MAKPLNPIYQTSPAKRKFLEGLARTMSGNAGASQCQRLLEALRKYALSTAECQRHLDIYDPAARIHNLRHRDGHTIETCWWYGTTESGVVHRIGRYTLVKEAVPRKAKKGGKQ